MVLKSMSLTKEYSLATSILQCLNLFGGFKLLVIVYLYTVKPHYNNKVLRTIKITLLYQVSHYVYQGKKAKRYKELEPAKLPCYKRVLLYPTSL